MLESLRLIVLELLHNLVLPLAKVGLDLVNLLHLGWAHLVHSLGACGAGGHGASRRCVRGDLGLFAGGRAQWRGHPHLGRRCDAGALLGW